jgi:hypothetical protein
MRQCAHAGKPECDYDGRSSLDTIRARSTYTTPMSMIRPKTVTIHRDKVGVPPIKSQSESRRA